MTKNKLKTICVLLIAIFIFIGQPTRAQSGIKIIITGQSLSNQVLNVDEQLSLFGHSSTSQKFGVPGAEYQVIAAYEQPFIDSVAYGGDFVVLIHGERDANIGTPLAEYTQFVHKLQSDYSNELGFDIPLITDQISSRGQYGTNDAYISNISRAQWRAAKNSHFVYLVGPGYMYPRVEDGIHLTESGNQWHGEQVAKVINTVNSGISWRPLEPDGVIINGNVVTLTLHVPVMPLQIDTSTLPAKQNLGFEWYDTSGAKISSIAIDDNNIVFYLDKIPDENSMYLRYAYSGSGIATFWGNIKDSDNTLSYGGHDLSNWLVHFNIKIASFGVYAPIEYKEENW